MHIANFQKGNNYSAQYIAWFYIINAKINNYKISCNDYSYSFYIISSYLCTYPETHNSIYTVTELHTEFKGLENFK